MQNLNNTDPDSNNTSTFSIHFNAEAQDTNQTSSNNPQDKTNSILKRSLGEMHAETSTSTDTPTIKKARKLGEDLQNTPEKSYECMPNCLGTEEGDMLAKDFFKGIPEDFFESISSFLDMKQRAMLGHINKTWHRIMFTNLQYPSLIGVPIPLVASLRIQEIIERPVDWSKCIELNNIKKFFHGTTLTAFSSVRNLELALTDEHVDWLANDVFSIRYPTQTRLRCTSQFARMAALMPNLQILYLSLSDDRRRQITGEQFNKFKDLSSLHSIELVSPSNAALAELTPTRFPLLKHLVLQCGPTTDDEGMRHLANLTTLQEISIDGYGWGRRYLSLEYFRTLPSLTALELDCCDVTDSSLAQLSGLTTLKELRLKEIESITDDAFSRLDNLQLESLDLAIVPGITGSLFRHLNPLRLKRLSLTGQDNIAADFVSIAAFTALEDLCLYDCRGLRDYHIQSLAGMTSLKSLNLSKCTRITPACINDLRRSLPFTDIEDVKAYPGDDSLDREYEGDEADEEDERDIR